MKTIKRFINNIIYLLTFDLADNEEIDRIDAIETMNGFMCGMNDRLDIHRDQYELLTELIKLNRQSLKNHQESIQTITESLDVINKRFKNEK